MSEIHPAWHIYDIWTLIIEHLEPRSLFRLAQTSKLFFEFATDELWRNIHSFSPFISCLPRGFQSRRLREEDLQRFNIYSAKVQHLVLEGVNMNRRLCPPAQFKTPRRNAKKGPWEPWKKLWTEIGKLQPTSDFLPNLRKLRISSVADELLIPLVGISGSNLTRVYIKYTENRKPESTVLQILDRLQHTPKLKYLFVRDGEIDLLPSRLIRQSPLDHLRLDPRIHDVPHKGLTFKKFPLRYDILQKTTLEHLTLGLTREWCGPEMKTLEHKYLPALKTLWLNLTTFKSEKCNQSCINISSDSWTCVGDRFKNDRHLGPTDCGRRPPTLFFEQLNNPELSLLNVKFPFESTGIMFRDVVLAASKCCRLRNLIELALAGDGWHETYQHPNIIKSPADLREALKILLPMPQLKWLRLSVAPTFLDILDIQLYKSITNGLPALEKLWLGHTKFIPWSCYGFTSDFEKLPLHYLAAFCSMLPNLVEVSVPAVDNLVLEKSPRTEWACPSVKSLNIVYWGKVLTKRNTYRDLDKINLETYFPNSDLTKKVLNNCLVE